jgi:hypothetical protein
MAMALCHCKNPLQLNLKLGNYEQKLKWISICMPNVRILLCKLVSPTFYCKGLDSIKIISVHHISIQQFMINGLGTVAITVGHS